VIRYYQYADGTFHNVHQSGSVVYYLGRGPNVAKTVPFPEGFKMLSGRTAARAFDTSLYVRLQGGEKEEKYRSEDEHTYMSMFGAGLETH
jgi:hypothetical protein